MYIIQAIETVGSRRVYLSGFDKHSYPLFTYMRANAKEFNKIVGLMFKIHIKKVGLRNVYNFEIVKR